MSYYEPDLRILNVDRIEIVVGMAEYRRTTVYFMHRKLEPAPPASKFSATEDALLLQIVSSMEAPVWPLVAERLGTRTARQCRERYKNYLAPDLSNQQWTPEEENLLSELYDRIGPKWVEMKPFFPARSCVNIKVKHGQLAALASQAQLPQPRIQAPPEASGRPEANFAFKWDECVNEEVPGRASRRGG